MSASRNVAPHAKTFVAEVSTKGRDEAGKRQQRWKHPGATSILPSVHYPVIPAQAGTQPARHWVPACAGMTGRLIFACRRVVLFLIWGMACASTAFAAPPTHPSGHESLSDRALAWPSVEQWRRVLLLEDYNSRVVILGTTLLGCAAGVVGSFTLLRKRALMGDAISHATLPGIALAFIVATAAGANGKALPVLLSGATVSGLVGVAAILMIRRLTRLKEDAALGIVLSVSYGAGVSLLGVIQNMSTGHAAGLESFIYGKTASMGLKDAWMIALAAAVCLVVCLLLFKELKLLCFDEGFAGSDGYPTVLLDIALMTLVVIVSIVGLQAVGLILMVALLVIPAAAARFWTESMLRMTVISAVLGAAGGMLGAAMSALFSNLPSGAMIVLVCAAFFVVSMMFGSARGALTRWLRRRRLNRRVQRQHLLRAMFELLEAGSAGVTSGMPVPAGAAGPDGSAGALLSQWLELRTVAVADLLQERSWSIGRLRHEIRSAEDDGLVSTSDAQHVRLTTQGFREAARLTRQHRLWELYLITYAEVAAARVDRDADAIEHVLEPEIVARLEALLEKREVVRQVPASPHELAEPRAAGGAG
ncbi:MAG: iron chelate uptake ABC transporter family permease subunit [Planctomycetaceae bacterium]